MILKVGSAEPLSSTKQGDGFRKASSVKNCAANIEHSCRSCVYNPRLHVERRSISKKKRLHEINIVKYNIMKQGQGFRNATFVKNSVMKSEHSCQSCQYNPRLHVERRSISEKEKKVFMTFTLSNKTFLLL